MSKRYSIFICVLFCAFLGVFVTLHLAMPDRSFSENENRYLEKMPTLILTGSQANVLSGEFMSDFETYMTDQFPLRDAFISIKAACELMVGKVVNNGVYFGEQDTIFASIAHPEDGLVEQNLGYVETLAEKVDIPVYFSLVPNKLHVDGDLLNNPPMSVLLGIEERLALSLNYLGEDLWEKAAQLSSAVWVDMMPIFQSHEDEGLFYRTDHHWTTLGAYYGYVSLMEGMGIDAVPLSDYEKTTVSDDFLGTTYSSSGAAWIEPDVIDIYVPDEGLSVMNYGTGTPREGVLYDESKLSVKDKYSYFLGGNTPLAIIKTTNTEAPKVLIVRDSYSDSLAPFLTAHFSEIHLLDLRYNNTPIPQYLADHDIDSVVVLYSMSNFLTDNNLFKMGIG